MKDCGLLFPGVPCRQMKPEELGAYVADIKQFGFTPPRKMRLLQSVGRLLSTLAFDYSVRYGGKIAPVEFCGAAWFAINSTVEHFDVNEDSSGNSFTTLLIYWARHEFDKLIYRNLSNKRYSGDNSNLQFVSLEKKTTNEKDGDGPRIIDTLGDLDTVREIEQLESRQRIKQIFKAAELDQRSKYIIKNNFGLVDGVELDYSTISQNMGVGKERVRQIKNAAIKRLQAAAKTTTEKKECLKKCL